MLETNRIELYAGDFMKRKPTDEPFLTAPNA
jgi:hypothetical protein